MDSKFTGKERWTFSGIEENFDSHVSKSVPLYDEFHELALSYADFLLKTDSVILDLGCSTGTFANKLCERFDNLENLKVIGVDEVDEMVAHAQAINASDRRIEFAQQKIELMEFPGNTQLVTSFFTLQFLHPRHRQDTIQKIYDSLDWGGGFILAEKVRAPDARFQDWASQIYLDFKTRQGYSDDEINSKSRSLRGVMEPFSTEENKRMLARAGFVDVMTIGKWVCFEVFLAVK